MLLAFSAFFWLTAIKTMHMFQLNSYKPATHMKWQRQNLQSLIPGVAGFLAAMLCQVLTDLVANIVLLVVFAILALVQKPKKAKKPLVYTMRVIRMLVTLGILFLLGVGLAVFSGGGLQGIVLASLAMVCPRLVLVANFINKPIEGAINQYYINDAKRMLKSHTGLTTIGVTGSYGKTSVKFILKTLLSAKFNVLATPESYNTPMGVVITVRNFLRPTHEVFVCEMGARHVGDIKEMCRLVTGYTQNQPMVTSMTVDVEVDDCRLLTPAQVDALSMLEPFIMIVLAVFVVILVLAIFLPMLNMTKAYDQYL